MENFRARTLQQMHLGKCRARLSSRLQITAFANYLISWTFIILYGLLVGVKTNSCYVSKQILAFLLIPSTIDFKLERYWNIYFQITSCPISVVYLFKQLYSTCVFNHYDVLRNKNVYYIVYFVFVSYARGLDTTGESITLIYNGNHNSCTCVRVDAKVSTWLLVKVWLRQG